MSFIELDTPDALQYKFQPVASGSFHFKVRAAHDAHIALTSGPGESDPMIEVFIGGWSNTKSVIRKNRTKPDKSEANTPDVLSAGEYRGFWIRWFDGVYTVGNEGEAAAFLSYQDNELIPINFAGVCTGWGASGSWIIEGRQGEFKTADSLNYQFQPLNSGNVTIHFKGPSNCHIGLFTTKAETKPCTEILIGGWENKASVIRLNQDKSSDMRVETPNIVSSSEYRIFYVNWQNGHVVVKLGNANGKVLIERKNCANFKVNFLGVRTAWGATGSWKINIGGSLGGQTGGRPTPILAPRSGAGGGWNATPLTCGGGQPCWVPSSGNALPAGAVAGGRDSDGTILYVGRARHEGALIPGKLNLGHGVVYVPWGGGEHGHSDYEVLVGGANWVNVSGGGIPGNAIPAGESEDGEPLFVGRAHHEGSVTIGKVQPSHNVCYIPYGGSEIAYDRYEVLTN